jgi:hypothetical protein
VPDFAADNPFRDWLKMRQSRKDAKTPIFIKNSL